MRIAYIANSRFPSEKAQSDHLMAMCSAFAKLGHEVTLFVPDRRNTLHEDAFVYYKKDPVFTIQKIPCFDIVQFGVFGFWIQSLSFIWNTRKMLKKYSPDISYSRILHLFLFFDIPGIRIWESHAPHKTTWAVKTMKKRVDRIVALTHQCKADIVAQGVPEERIFVEPDAVDPELFKDSPSYEQARLELNIPEDVFLFLYTGKFRTMGMSKGLDESIEAINRLRTDYKVMLLAVGGTKEEIASYAKFSSEFVCFLGHRPQIELKKYYVAANALLMPFPKTTHFAKYMSPLKLFEYLFSHKPIIATKLPSVLEIVDESSVFLANPGDPLDLMRAMKEVIDSPILVSERVQEAYKIGQRYTWEKRGARILEWIEK